MSLARARTLGLNERLNGHTFWSATKMRPRPTIRWTLPIRYGMLVTATFWSTPKGEPDNNNKNLRYIPLGYYGLFTSNFTIENSVQGLRYFGRKINCSPGCWGFIRVLGFFDMKVHLFRASRSLWSYPYWMNHEPGDSPKTQLPPSEIESWIPRPFSLLLSSSRSINSD